VAYEVPVTQARAEFADLVNRVVYGGERIVVTRHGKAIVALVPAADLDRLEQLDGPDRAEQPDQPLSIVRLSSDPVGQSTQPQPPERGFDIAARLRPPHDGPTQRE
jgi:prevent-host-death family protein